MTARAIVVVVVVAVAAVAVSGVAAFARSRYGAPPAEVAGGGAGFSRPSAQFAYGGAGFSRPSAQTTFVEVTAVRANVREAPSLDARVVTQVTAGTMLEAQAPEAGWYKVRIAVGGIRIEGYLATSVAKPVAAPAGADAPATATSSAAAVVRDGMSVALQHGETTIWLIPETLGVVAVPGRPGAIQAIAQALPAADAAAPAGGAPATFAWTLPATTPGADVSERRPWLVIQLENVPGVAPTRLTAQLVQLVPAPAGVQVVAGVPGRADQAIWGDPDWDVMGGLQQAEVRTSTERLGPGAIRLRPEAALVPGTYAVVVRPATRDRLSGADVFRGQREGVVFGVAWPFTIR